MRHRLTDRVLCGALSIGMAALFALTPGASLAAMADEEAGVADEQEPVAEEKEDFVIASAADWSAFAELAHSADWSMGRTVRLTADIDLAGETQRIVYFAGTFDGAGHTIDGVSIRAEIAKAGLFDLIDTNGAVKNLSVIGAVYPKGRQTTIGGIVGVNRGIVESCAWFGSVEAHSEVGGIAGRNEESGVIRDCRAGGIAQGDSGVGGIAGHNLGNIRGCTNETQVNTVYTDVPFSADELTVTLNEILQTGRITTPDNVDQKTDIGGIAGFSSGTLENCENRGRIGYEHVGFNIGGIVGRSSGLVKNSRNEGEIFGRREVGGIVGQQQPDLTIRFSDGRLGEIDTALDELQGMIDAALTDTDHYSGEASELLAEISRLTGVAKNDVQTLTDEAAARADAEAARANDTTGKVRASADDISEAAGRLQEAGGNVMDYAQELTGAFFDEEQTAIVAAVLDRLREAYARMSAAAKTIISIADDNPEESMKAALQTTEFYMDARAIDAALEPVMRGIADEEDAADMFRVLAADSEKRREFLSDLTAVRATEFTGAMETVQRALAGYLEENEALYGDDRYKLLRDWRIVRDNTEEPLDTLAQDVEALLEGLVTQELKEQYDAADASLRELSEMISQLVRNSDAQNREDLERARENLDSAFGSVRDASERIAGIDLNISGLSATTRAASGDLYATIDRMLAEANALNASVRGATSGTVDHLKGINAQMGYLSDLLEDAVEAEINRSVDPADYTEDISGEDFENAESGRTTGCRNAGTVRADGDAGGIAGLMGVDMQLDPERDITALTERSTDATMLEKAILDDCENAGRVEIGGNYVGGIAGRMQLGIIYGCRSLGMIDAGGSYAGGIVGFSGAAVKACLVRTHIRAQSYAGGVAGLGDVLTENRAMVRILDAEQAAGAIAGAVSEVSSEKLSDNLWCGGGVRAVGDVDYAGLAEETDYEAIAAGAHGMFQRLRLTFLADDEEIAELPVAYGATPAASEIPAVPEKEGFFGAWSRESFEDITTEDRIEAVYTRVVTLISSAETRGDGKPILFAEGSFAPDDVLEITAWSKETGNDPDGAGEEERVDLLLPEGQSGTHTFRFLPDASMGGVELYDGTDGERKLLATSTMGQYLTFAAPGRALTLYAVKKKSMRDLAGAHALPAGLGAAGAAAVLALGAGIIRKRKKKEVSEQDAP